MKTTTRAMAAAVLAALALAAGGAALRADGGALALNGQAGYFGSGHEAERQPAPAPLA